jgi:hypothetical protein
MDAKFKAWPTLNDPELQRSLGVSHRSRLQTGLLVDVLLRGDTLQARFSRALAARRAVDRKEFFEAFEFFARCRGSLHSEPADWSGAPATLVDLAGGHGLVAALFAVFEYKRFESVLVLDATLPKSFGAVYDAAVEVAPWSAASLRYVEAVVDAETILPGGCAVACLHGCNSLTDTAIGVAARSGASSLAVMPCCYAQTAQQAPEALRRSLGVAVASDIHRTYELERLGYTVNWRSIPLAITPMNRVLLGRRKRS